MVHRRDVVVLHQLQREIHGAAAYRHEHGRLEQLRPLRQFAQRIDGHEARHKLHDDELILIFHGGGTYQNHRYVRYEGRSRVHEHAYEYRCYGERQHVDVQYAVAHHHRHEYREQRYHRVEHGDAARLFKVVLAEQAEIRGEQHYERGHEEYLSGYCRRYSTHCCAAPLRLLLKRVEHPVRVVVHYFAAVYYLLSAEHHSACQRYRAEQVGLLGLAALLVIVEVRLYIFVQVAFLQSLPLFGQLLVGEQLFIGRHRRVDAHYFGVGGLLAAHNPYGACGVLAYL